MYIKWLIFSCDLLSFYSVVHFLKIWLSGIMAITNNIDYSASPWNMPKLCPPAVNSTGLLDKQYDLIG